MGLLTIVQILLRLAATRSEAIIEEALFAMLQVESNGAHNCELQGLTCPWVTDKETIIVSVIISTKFIERQSIHGY